MIVEFNLSPIDEVNPWGEMPNQSIHWFALTQGEYRLKVGKDYLLNYSQEYGNYCLKNFPQYSFSTTFVDYYVVRLWEDIIEMLPDILSPVPTEIQHIINSDYETLSKWIETASEIDADKEIDILTNWLWIRRLDSGYLTNAARIWIWSDEDNVTIQWDNREVKDNNNTVWSATFGSYQVDKTEFIDNLKSFDATLFSEMNGRIESISNNLEKPKVEIDIEQLKTEQNYRIDCLESNLKNAYKTDWDEIISAINQINIL